MIEKTQFGLMATCDHCTNFELEADTFAEVIELARKEGWTIIKLDGEYEHFCPGCKEYAMIKEFAL